MTPAMIDYAQSPVFRKGWTSLASLVSFAFVLCFAIPAFFTFTTIVKHRPLGSGGVFLWVLCGLAASALIYGGLGYNRSVRRDLAGGVYIRWSGPFTTRVVRFGTRGAKGFEVDAGGRRLGPGTAVRRLPPIGFNSGTVDYLPASNLLCEVRNEQGTLLWGLFGDSPGREGGG